MYTGYVWLDVLIVALIAALPYAGGKFGVPLLTALADLLARLKRPEPEAPANAVALKADVAKPVALPFWLSLVWPLVVPLINAIIDQLAKRYGLNITEFDRVEIVHQVSEDLRKVQAVEVIE